MNVHSIVCPTFLKSFIFIYLETQSCYESQAALKLMTSYLTFPIAGVTGIYHHARVQRFFLPFLVGLKFELRAFHLLGRNSYHLSHAFSPLCIDCL
jgi:hypothetical protein